MLQRALITGIGGFAGGFLAEHLLKMGDAVLGVSLDGRWEPYSAPELSHQVDLISWDLGMPNGLGAGGLRAIQDFQPTVIYHLAALSIPEDCGKENPSASALAVNVDGTRHVLELVAALPSRPRVLAVSSSHVYAPIQNIEQRLNELSPIGPVGGYGKTKWAAEEEVRLAVRDKGIDAVIARPFQHAGPRQNNRMMLSQWASQLAADPISSITVYTLNAFIDLCDVRDVVRAYRLLAERGVCGEAYNIGSGIVRRSGEVLQLLLDLVGFIPQVVESRPGVHFDQIADISKILQVVGWASEIPIETTVADTLAWWRQQKKPSSK